MNLKIAVLALVTVVLALSSFVVFQYLSTPNSNQSETLKITDSAIWHPQAGLIIENRGKANAEITRITARGVDCSWNDVYVWKGEIGSVSSINSPANTLSGTSSVTVVDGVERVFTQATGRIEIGTFEVAVIFINDINIVVEDLPCNVTIAVFTEKDLYTTETVAVAPPIPFMGTEEVRITNVSFSENQITVTAKNTGTSPVTINELLINNQKQTYTPQTAQPDDVFTATINFAWNAGDSYQIKLVSSKGNPFVYTATAPSA